MENLTDDNIDVKMVLDPRLNYNEVPKFYFEKGGLSVRHITETSTNYSSRSVRFNPVPPNQYTSIDKKIKIDVPLRITLTGPDDGSPLVEYKFLADGVTKVWTGNTNSIRFMGFQQCCSTVSLKLNTTSVSLQTNEIIEPLMRYGFTDDYLRKDLSGAAIMPDQYQSLSDWKYYGSIRNPMNSYGNSFLTPRGALNYELVDVTNTSAIIDVTISEYLLLPPAVIKRMNEKAFVGVKSIDLLFVLEDLSKIWCRDEVNASPLDSIDVQIRDNPILRMTYISSPMIEAIPLVNQYPYYKLERFPTEFNTILQPGQSTTKTTQTIMLSGVPKRAMVFLRETNSDKSYRSADCYAHLKNIKVNFANMATQLGNSDSRSLFDMSVYNGLNMSYYQWSRQCGSIACIDFGHDMGLPRDLAPSVGKDQYQLSLDLEYENISSEPRRYAAYIITITPGVYTLMNGTSQVEDAPLLPANIMESIKLSELEAFTYNDAIDYSGGSFWGSLRNIGKKVGRFLSRGVDLAKKAAPYVERYGPQAIRMAEKAAPLLMGLGLEAGSFEGEVGGARMGGRRGNYMGGRPIRRRSFRR